MGIERRGIDPGVGPGITSSQTAENDTHFTEYVYNDTSGQLGIGQLVYIDCTDAAEWNAANPSTALNPATGRTAGTVILASNANQSNLVCVGVFAPDNAGSRPNKGDVIRVLDRGRGIVSAIAYFTAGVSVKVGDILIVDNNLSNSAKSNGGTYISGQSIGIACATLAAVTKNAVIIPVPSSGNSGQILINAHIKLT